MSNNLDTGRYLELYKDFLHPNPNINFQAVSLLKKEFSSKFIRRLLNNLEEDDLILRRKSILALGIFGEESFNSIVQLYFSTESNTVKISCLKTILKVIVNFNIKELDIEIMSVINIAIKDNSSEITLIVISILRQLETQGKRILMRTCRDKNLLRAKASISALLEINDPEVDNLLNQLLNDNSIDPMIREDICHRKFI